MRVRRAGLLFALALAVTRGYAQNLDLLSPYRPGPAVSGKLVAWGDDSQRTLLAHWKEGFQKHQPSVEVEDSLKSTATAMGALWTGTANITLFGRDTFPLEILGFKRVFGYEPLGVMVGTGSYDIEDRSYALAIGVHKDNPLTRITLTQLDAIFGNEHRRGAKVNIRKWGQLGLKGGWADKPIHVYGYPVDLPGIALLFSVTTFNGSTKWNPDLREFGNLEQPDGTEIPAGARITEALARDRYGIAVSGFRYRNPMVKTLAVAATDGGPYVAGTKETVANRSYPLTRSLVIYVNRNPVKGLDPTVKEFLRYVLSRDGQEAVSRDGDYLPLTAEAIQKELRKVE